MSWKRDFGWLKNGTAATGTWPRRAPHCHPNAVWPEMEDVVMAVREQHPSWGAPKIQARLKPDHAEHSIPAERTIAVILKRNGLTVARKRRRAARR